MKDSYFKWFYAREEASIRNQLLYNPAYIYTQTGFAMASMVMKSIYEQLYDEPTGWIRIYTGNLTQEISSRNGYLDVLHRFLTERSHRVELLIDEDPVQYQNAIQALQLLNSFPTSFNLRERIQIRVLPREMKPMMQSLLRYHPLVSEKILASPVKTRDITDFHFAVSSNQMFRLSLNPDSFQAIYSFNQPKICGLLDATFRTYFAKAHSFLPEREKKNRQGV